MKVLKKSPNPPPLPISTMPSSKFTTPLNLSKCTLINNNGSSNPPETAADDSAVSGESNLWPPTTAVVDRLVLNLKAKDGDDTEANWEKIMLNFKKELEEEEEEQLKPRLLTSDVVINSSSHSHSHGGDGRIEKVVRARAKFSVPLSRREMEKDFEDMGERRLPRKPKKRPKSIQNQLDTLFPGLWLTEINADLYRVSDTKKVHHHSSSFSIHL
ncbi:hypothetical protein OSB04_008820 [Centaurea solstitialis]|uniref:Uncharacterized protein n=1 Tax=Centaurea solstitialis TaxID=347529 RepID=A0AA38WRM9_9ASTR|nr:hypothetical protein OSB04_008820 [Centaurea solstitialis]